MSWMLARWLALFPFFVGADGFHPFAGVEDLKPQRLDDFCERPASGRGLRWCQHSFRKRLEDGGIVEHSWRMHADPESILSLDTEAEHGVHVLKCDPGRLELELPISHARHATPGQMVVGSRFVHRCGHLPDRHLYSRVTKVQQLPAGVREPWLPRVQRVWIATEELPNLAHVVPFLTFSFSYMPEEARNVVPDPEMVTDYGLNRELLKSRGRKLASPPPPSPMEVLKDLASEVDGVDVDDGGFKHGGSSAGSINTQNGILNFEPKQVSNFGWNWDFFMNTTESPSFDIKVPGARGVLKLQKPYIKIHSGIFLNFTSLFEGLTKVPKVKWTAGLKGHGKLQARIQGALNTTGSATVNPFNEFDLDMLDKLKTPQWFQKFDFAAGHLPVSFQPGFQFQAKLYHAGTFHGAVVFGVNTHGMLNPTMSFDSLKGLDLNVKADLINTTIIPPFWMIFTKRFEMGMQLKPAMLMKGDFNEEEKATVGVEFRPYLNFSVSRAGEGGYGENMKTLTVYPVRVMGLNDEQFKNKYKVKIQVLDREIETTPHPNWGQVQFHDRIEKFSVDQIPEKAVIKTPIQVTLIEVDENPHKETTERTLGVGTLRCSSLLNGVCHPAPPLAVIKDGAIEVAAVEFAILWQDNPRSWYASKIRGLTVTFPQVVLRQDAINEKEQEISVHLVHGGRTYTVPIKGDAKTQRTALHGTTAIEFGPTFLESWMPCPAGVNANKCESPRLELYAGSQASAIAVANLPQIEWTSQTAMQGTRAGPFSSAGSALNVPADVALYKLGTGPGTGTPPVAVVKMNTKVLDMPSSSLFFKPSMGTQVNLDRYLEFVWLVSEVDEDSVYGFQLSPFKLFAPKGLDMQKYVKNRKIQGKVLVPVGKEPETSTTKCQRRAVAGMPADAASCSFAYNLTIGTGFSVGDQGVLRVQWTKNGMVHETWSPPFEVILAVARRLKGNQKPLAPVPRRQLASAAGDGQPCQAKNLHFQVGVGALVRAWVDQVNLPQGFPLLGGLDEAPAISTGLRKIASAQPGADAQDVFPKELCNETTGTVCQAVLPGCMAVPANSRFFPSLVLNHNRPFHYNQSSKSKFYILMKEALAYAFSTLPEAVDILIKEVNETRTKGEHDEKHPSILSGSNRSWPATFKHWWGERRLHEEADVEEGGRVEMHFREGLPFRLTHPLVAAMLKNYHTEVEDDATESLGPLRITSFFLDESISHDFSNPRAGLGHGAGEELRRFSPSSAVIFLATACAAVLAVAAISMARHHKPWQKRAYHYRSHQSSDSDESGLE